MECEHCEKQFVETENALAEYMIHLAICHDVNGENLPVLELHEGRPDHFWYNYKSKDRA